MNNYSPIFTEEQLTELYPAEIHFESALKKSKLVGVPTWLTKQIVTIYEKATGKHISHNFSCIVCQMSTYKKIGDIYFKDKEYYANLKKETIEEQPKQTKKSKKN